MAVDLFVQDDNNFILDIPVNDIELNVGQPVVTRIEKDYEELNNKPSINNVVLIGDKSFEDLGLVDATAESSGLMSAADKTALDSIPSELQDIRESIPTKTSELENDSGFITDAGVTSFNGQTGDITYSAPVTSVNGQTGDVTGLQEQLTFDSTPTEDSNNPVTSDGIYTALGTKENLTNKVTVISSDSTDSQYPSAKCVYDNFKAEKPQIKVVLYPLGISSEVFILFQNFSEYTTFAQLSASTEFETAIQKSVLVYYYNTNNFVTQAQIYCGLGAGISDQWNILFNDAATIDNNIVNGVYGKVEYAGGDWHLVNWGFHTPEFKGYVDDEITRVENLIPTKTSNLVNDGADGTSTYVEADDLATVATSGAYSDLTGQPTNLSDFNNDVGYITSVPVTSVDGKTGAVNILPSGGNAGQVLKKNSATNYDVHWANETETYPSGYCTTAGGTATKVVNCSLWTATPNTYLHILIAQANSYADAITMKINASSPIPVYINGDASSSTNYSLPAGSYIAFYDGTNIYLRTDGQLPGNIVGVAAGTEAKLATKADSAGASANYAAKLTACIPYGECNSTSTSTAFTATVPGITELKDGVTMLLYNGVVTSASGFTININGLGAKPSYSNMALGNPVTPTSPTRDTTIFNINYAFLFVYSETLVSGGCWIGYRGYDANTNTIGYQLRTNQTTMKTTDKFYRYRLLFTSADGTKWVPANTSTSTNATAVRTPNTRAIDPFGEIVWYGTTTAIEANANVTAAQLWQEYYGSYTSIGYSFNNTGAAQTMTAALPIYIKCTPQADGSAIIDPTTPYTQTLPSTDDGKIYIYLGRAYNATNFEITMNHPVYYHDGSGIRLWTGQRIPAGLPSVSAADNGKVLQVVNGAWAVVLIPNGNGVNF